MQLLSKHQRTTRTLISLFLIGLLASPCLPAQPLPSPAPSPAPAPPALPLSPFNERLEAAYVAFQAWKHAITEDPKNLTKDWCGPFVCNYTGVFCAAAPDDPHTLTVAGVDLNHGDIAGCLPDHLGLLADVALLHLNSNRFRGMLPPSMQHMRLLFELDVSNNLLSGAFPAFLTSLPKLKFLDLRFNGFDGELPDAVFGRQLGLDALFANNNRFNVSLSSKSLTNSTASVIVLANTRLAGCLPPSIGDMADTLVELILLNTSISSCIPPEIGKLKKLKVLDLSHNDLAGELPDSIGDMESLEVLNVGYNMLAGEVPEAICELPRLRNLTIAGNYFCDEPVSCLHVPLRDDRMNCIPDWPHQRSPEECIAFAHRPPPHCAADGCIVSPP
ncbi:leucine-rich repeat extensin-like protein 6 [Oryza brachyantha]|uniref:non-specific serine/threonine protein kinase n=1 Tax=Oryza brachyantha TaxID=4533 RepID=J3LR01_ORYBR|nr:leucine-rich repeat extensin-like protein 6 [Oryza brachyantha]